MAGAVIFPLLVAVAVERHVVRRIGNAEIAKDPFIRREFWQPFCFYPPTDVMGIVHRDLNAGRRVSHLAYLAFADDVETLDHLERRFPVPYVGGKFKVLAAEIG